MMHSLILLSLMLLPVAGVALWVGLALRRQAGRPRLVLGGSALGGQLEGAVVWNSRKHPMSFYRVRLVLANPLAPGDGQPCDGFASFTLPAVQTHSFSFSLKVPERWRPALEHSPRRGPLLSLEVRAVEPAVLAKTFWARAELASPRRCENHFDLVGEDLPAVLTLDAQEMVVREKKIAELKEAAKARLAKAAARTTATSEVKP